MALKSIIQHKKISRVYVAIVSLAACISIVLAAGSAYLFVSYQQNINQLANAARRMPVPAPTSIKDIPPQPEPVDQPPKVPEPPAVPEKTVHDNAIPPVVNGRAPLLYRIPTNEPVVFLGIDDGAFKDPSVVSIMKKNNIKASLYLSDLFISSNPTFFQQIVDNGSLVEDHTLEHDTRMSTYSYEYQKNEICGMADKIEQYYGRRPIFFRPPGGAYTDTTLVAAADCGMKAVVTWVAKANGGSMQYQIGDSLRPGDIVLMHFRPEFAKDMQAFVDAQNAAGLHTELLENWQ